MTLEGSYSYKMSPLEPDLENLVKTGHSEGNDEGNAEGTCRRGDRFTETRVHSGDTRKPGEGLRAHMAKQILCAWGCRA